MTVAFALARPVRVWNKKMADAASLNSTRWLRGSAAAARRGCAAPLLAGLELLPNTGDGAGLFGRILGFYEQPPLHFGRCIDRRIGRDG